jgi:CarD family transcriptional regulator
MPDLLPDFQLGEMAVYPGYGVAEILRIEQREFSGAAQSFYVLKVLGKEMTLMVPLKSAGSVGLRSIIKGGQIDEVYAVLQRRGEKISTATWNRRYREYMEKIRSGSIIEIATVMRDLCILRSEKELSYGERNMLDSARTLVIQELALAKGQEAEALEREIDRLFDPPKGSVSASAGTASPS